MRCCYCGARSILAPGAKRLVCCGCGAPITVIEALEPPPKKAKGKTKGKPKPAVPHAAERPGQHAETDRAVRRKKGKRRKGVYQRFLAAIDDFDDLEDLFDIFD